MRITDQIFIDFCKKIFQDIDFKNRDSLSNDQRLFEKLDAVKYDCKYGRMIIAIFN